MTNFISDTLHFNPNILDEKLSTDDLFMMIHPSKDSLLSDFDPKKLEVDRIQANDYLNSTIPPMDLDGALGLLKKIKEEPTRTNYHVFLEFFAQRGVSPTSGYLSIDEDTYRKISPPTQTDQIKEQELTATRNLNYASILKRRSLFYELHPKEGENLAQIYRDSALQDMKNMIFHLQWARKYRTGS